MEADEPWQALACCMEIARASRSPDPAAHVSHFPVHQVSWGTQGAVCLAHGGLDWGVSGPRFRRTVWGPAPAGPAGLAGGLVRALPFVSLCLGFPFVWGNSLSVGV